MSLWPRSMRSQLIFLLLGALVAVQCLSIWLFLDERHEAMMRVTAKDAVSRVLNIANELQNTDSALHAVMIRAAESQEFRLSVDAIALAQGRHAFPLSRLQHELQRVFAAMPPRELLIALRSPEPPPSIRPELGLHEDNDELELIISAALPEGWLNARVDLGEAPFQWAWPAIMSILLTMGTVITVVWLLVRRIAEPLQSLVLATRCLGQGQAMVHLPCSGPAEIQQLTACFNEMADRLIQLLAERSRTLAAIGHDLRSPITAMRLRVELIDDDEERERIGLCLDEIETLVQAALALASGNSDAEPVRWLSIAGLLRSLVNELIEEGGLATLDMQDDVMLPLRMNAFKRAIRNIAQNAIRYGGEANIRVVRREERVLILVEDHGPGIAEADRDRVFEPFVRLEPSRNRDTGGNGLGLAIAKAVIESHGGDISIGVGAHGGALITITMPCCY